MSLISTLLLAYLSFNLISSDHNLFDEAYSNF